MSSILTNNSAMVALQTMKGINKNLSMVQSEIATGKTVANAKDNSAVWAISKVMESDVEGFKAISDSLSLGSSTIAVARKASETVTKLLTEMQGKIVSAQESNVDREKIQADVAALKSQIESVVGAAQFNGLNLVDGTQTSVDVLASLDRSGTSVSTSSISVTAQNLSTGGYTAKDVFTGTTGVATGGDTAGFTLASGGTTGTVQIAAVATAGDANAFAAGDKVSIRIGDKSASYTVTAEDVASTTPSDVVAIGLKNSIEKLGIKGLSIDYSSGTPGALTFTNAATYDTGQFEADGTTPITAATKNLSVSLQFTNADSGGLGALSGIDVSTASGAKAALGNIQDLLQTSINASAAFGSVEKRIDIQNDFVGELSDALKSGIGTLVDADLEETSARLQALQVQQQLGTQALSIANQQPQNLLSLFR